MKRKLRKKDIYRVFKTTAFLGCAVMLLWIFVPLIFFETHTIMEPNRAILFGEIITLLFIVAIAFHDYFKALKGEKIEY